MFVIVLAWRYVIGGKWFVGFALVVSAFCLFCFMFVWFVLWYWYGL